MAFLKLKFCKNPNPRKRAKAHVRYFTHRPNRDQERGTRELFSNDGNPITPDKAYAYRLIDEAGKGSRFFKLMFSPSPDPNREDTYRDLPLNSIFRKMILSLEQKLGQKVEYIAALHDDHTDNRHIHSLLICNGRIAREDLAHIKRFATDYARRERRMRDGRPHTQTVYPRRYSPILAQDYSTPGYYKPSRFTLCSNCLSLIEKWHTRCRSCGVKRIRPYEAESKEYSRAGRALGR